MALGMKARRGKRLGGAPRGGRWGPRSSAAAPAGEGTYVLFGLVVITLLVVGAVAAFAWVMDFQLHRGILQQRMQAAARPDWVPLDALPPHVPHAFVLVVDPLFPERRSYEAGMQPTLTHQLLREVYLLRDGLSDQARALVMAPLLEERLSSSEILELYLNRVNLGKEQGLPIVGVYHAAREYFDKHPRELTLGEAATLAGLLLPPRIQQPQQWPGAVGARRNEVLRELLDVGLITPADYRAALQETLRFQTDVEHAPMTRPPGWEAEPEVIRVPAAVPEAAPGPEAAPAPEAPPQP